MGVVSSKEHPIQSKQRNVDSSRPSASKQLPSQRSEKNMLIQDLDRHDNEFLSPVTSPSEADDVIFHVGIDTVLRISARKENLSKKNEVFHAMFFGPYEQSRSAELRQRFVTSSESSRDQSTNADEMTSNNVIQIYDSDVDGRAFKNLIRFLNGESVELRSVVTAVETLHAAQKYLCDGLMEICVQYLAEQLSTDNVLKILQRCSVYAPVPSQDQLDNDNAPSAPPLDVIEMPLVSMPDVPDGPVYRQQQQKCWFSLLMNHCLHFIDKNASAVLASEDFEELDADMVELVVSRNDLHVHNETEILTALLRWSVFECHRRQLDVTVDNQRMVLDQFIWHVRYLAMPAKEVLNTPIISQLLSPKESTALFAYVMGRQDANQLPDVIRRNLQRISTARKYLTSKTSANEFPVDRAAPSCRKSCVTEKIFVCLACIFE